MTVLRLARLAAELTLTGAGRQHAALARRARAVGGSVARCADDLAAVGLLAVGLGAGIVISRLSARRQTLAAVQLSGVEFDPIAAHWRYIEGIGSQTTDPPFGNEGSVSWADGMGPSRLKLVS